MKTTQVFLYEAELKKIPVFHRFMCLGSGFSYPAAVTCLCQVHYDTLASKDCSGEIMDTKFTQPPPCITVPCIIFPKKEWNLPEQRLSIKAGCNIKFCYKMEDVTVPWKTVLG